MNKMKKYIFNKAGSVALGIITFAFAVIPENLLKKQWVSCWSDEINVIISRLIIAISVWILTDLIYLLYLRFRKRVVIRNGDTAIIIEYGDLFDKKNKKIVINFDECFTTKVGDAPAEIKKNSVCGQYLEMKPIDNIEELIKQAGIKPDMERSRYNNQIKYASGTLIPRENDLLMAFAKLDEKGLGHLTYEEYLKCLNVLWEQLDLYHGTDDIYLPILGSRITRMDRVLSQQQLLDIMIGSYKLSPKKLNAPNILHIVCRRREGFSINNIEGIRW